MPSRPSAWFRKSRASDPSESASGRPSSPSAGFTRSGTASGASLSSVGELTGKPAVFPGTSYNKRRSEAESQADPYEVANLEELLKEMKQLDDEKNRTAGEGALEWVNDVLKWLFPFGTEALATQMPSAMEDVVREKLPPGSGITMKVESFHLGQKPPLFTDLESYSHKTQGYDGIAVDFKVDWKCDCDIVIHVSKSVMGGKELGTTLKVKHFSVNAEVCFILCPLVDHLPVIGGVQVFMYTPPIVDWKFEDTFKLGKFTDLPMVNAAIRSAINESFQKEIVLPNRLFIPAPEISLLGGKMKVGLFDKDMTALRFPTPLAFFELGVVEAADLLAMDVGWNLAQTSDPFARVRIGTTTKETKHIPKDLNPKWGDDGWMDFPIYDLRQVVALEIFDKDELKANDLIGRLNGVTIGQVLENPGQFHDIFLPGAEQEVTGKETPTGRVKLEAVLYTLSRNKASLTRPPGKKTQISSYLTIHVRALRGLRESACKGAVLELEVEGTSNGTTLLKTKKSKASRAHLEDEPCDLEAQRMLEHLVLEKNHSVAKLAEISGLSAETVRAALQARKSFRCEWFQGFGVTFEDATKGVIKIKLVGATEARDKKIPRAELTVPFDVKSLINEQKMYWEGFLRLERPGVKEYGERELQVAGVEVGPFDLEVKFQLLGFMPHTLEFRERVPSSASC